MEFKLYYNHSTKMHNTPDHFKAKYISYGFFTKHLYLYYIS